MKITKAQLKRIIKEELNKALKEVESDTEIPFSMNEIDRIVGMFMEAEELLTDNPEARKRFQTARETLVDAKMKGLGLYRSVGDPSVGGWGGD